MCRDAISKNRKDERKEIKNAVPVTLHINNIFLKNDEHNVSKYISEEQLESGKFNIQCNFSQYFSLSLIFHMTICSNF